MSCLKEQWRQNNNFWMIYLPVWLHPVMTPIAWEQQSSCTTYENLLLWPCLLIGQPQMLEWSSPGHSRHWLNLRNYSQKPIPLLSSLQGTLAAALLCYCATQIIIIIIIIQIFPATQQVHQGLSHHHIMHCINSEIIQQFCITKQASLQVNCQNHNASESIDSGFWHEPLTRW